MDTVGIRRFDACVGTHLLCSLQRACHFPFPTTNLENDCDTRKDNTQKWTHTIRHQSAFSSILNSRPDAEEHGQMVGGWM